MLGVSGAIWKNALQMRCDENAELVCVMWCRMRYLFRDFRVFRDSESLKDAVWGRNR